MKCAKESCGAEITDGAKFCSICGTKVIVTTIVKKALCPDCNQFVLESHNFCLNCCWKVDHAIFTDKICRGVKENGEQCSVVLTFDTTFCPTCGTPTNSSDHNEKETKEDKELPESITTCNTDDTKASDLQSKPENPANNESDKQLENKDQNEKETKEDKELPESITTGNTDDTKASDLQSKPENPANNESDKQLENKEIGQNDDEIDGQPKSDDTENDEKKSEKSTEMKANDENNRNKDKTSPVEIAVVNKIAIQMATGDLDNGKKEEKTDELSGNQRKEIIKIEGVEEGQSNICEDSEEVSSGVVAEKQLISDQKVESFAKKNDDIPDPKSQSGAKNVDCIDEDDAESKLEDNLAVFVAAEDLGEYRYSVDRIQRENGTHRMIQPLSDSQNLQPADNEGIQSSFNSQNMQITKGQEKKAKICLQVQTNEDSLAVDTDTEKQAIAQSATGRRDSGEKADKVTQCESNNQISEKEKTKAAVISEVQTSAVGSTDKRFTANILKDEQTTPTSATQANEIEILDEEITENATKSDTTIKVMANSKDVAIVTKEKGDEKDKMENTVKTNEAEKSSDKIECQPVSETIKLNDTVKTNTGIKNIETGITEEKKLVDNIIEEEPNAKFETEENENDQADTESNDGSCYELAPENISDTGSGESSENDSKHADQGNSQHSQNQTKKESKSKESLELKEKQQRQSQKQKKENDELEADGGKKNEKLDVEQFASDDDDDIFEEADSSSVDDGTTTQSNRKAKPTHDCKKHVNIPGMAKCVTISNQQTKENRTKQKIPPGQQTGKKRNQDNTSSRRNRTSVSHFEIYFHAVLHTSFNNKDCTVFIEIELDNRGRWKSQRYEMTNLRVYENGNVELGAQVQVQRSFLKKTYYKYCIEYKDGNHTDEYIFNPGNTQSNKREIQILTTELKEMRNNTFHQYDGVIRGQTIVEKGIRDFIPKWINPYQYKKELLKDAEFSAYNLLPDFPLLKYSFYGPRGEEFVMMVKRVEAGLLNMYWQMEGCCTKSDFMKTFKQAMYSKFDPMMSDLHSKRACKKKGNRIKMSVNAATAIYLIHEYSIDVTMDDRIVFCQALLPECSTEEEGCPDIETLKEAFPTSFREMKIAVVRFVEQFAQKSSNFNWICSMPLVHFLCGQCNPWEKANDNICHDDPIPDWWGIASKEGCCNYNFDLRYKKDGEVNLTVLNEVMDILKPYFEMDYLLARTLMSALRFEQLSSVVVQSALISQDIIVATLCYFVRTETQIKENDKKETAIMECINIAIKSSCIDGIEKSAQSLIDAWRSYRISADLMKGTFLRKIKLRDIVIARILENFLSSLDLFYQLNEAVSIDEKPKLKDDFQTYFEFIEKETISWLKYKTSVNDSSELQGCLRAWNRIIDIGIPNGFVKERFTNYIAKSLDVELQSLSQDEGIVRVYCESQNEFCDRMLEVLTKFALKAVERSGKKMTTVYSKMDKPQVTVFGDLLSSVFEDKLSGGNIEDTSFLLQFSLSWKPFPLYIKMYNNIHASCLSPKCKEVLNNCDHCLQHIVDTLINGTILVGNLLLVKEQQDSLKSIVKEMKGVNYELYEKAVELRSAEYCKYQQCEQNLKQFIDLCHRFNANTEKLEEKIGEYRNPSTTHLNNICSIANVKKENRKHIPKVVAFQDYNTVLELLPEIITSSKGNIFINMWEKFGQQAVRKTRRQLEVTEIIEYVWKPANQELKDFVKETKSGNIMFKRFDDICGRFSEDHIRKELQLLHTGHDKKWIEKRIKQMEKYTNLQNYGRGAEIIMHVVNEFEIKGNFDPIQDILEMIKSGQDFKMNKFRTKLWKQCAVLRNIDGKKIKCLVKFKDSKPLIDWLRDKMPDGLKELKVFVDLAYISTGDDGMEIAKVTCFQSAAIGYAPLIFNLHTDCNYEDFLIRCKEVWNALDSNPKLPEELESTCQQLEWLKIVEKSHGSVEVTSLEQAEAINNSGTYHIGVRNNIIQEQQLQLSDVLELQVMEEQGGKSLHRYYSYEQLHDLQSRLMLVAGKAELGKDDVDRFILILDSVVRLCKIYIKLLSSGCVLFSKFHVVFRCDSKSTTCTFVSFGEGENKQTIRGKPDHDNEDVSCFVPRIAKFLEQSHDKWLQFIDNKREVDYILNFFTIEQMETLQLELVKVRPGDAPSDLIYPLLSVIKYGCTRDHIEIAMEEARKELEKIEISTKEEENKNHQVEESSDIAKTKFIFEMIESGYTEYLAEKALDQGVDATQIDDGIAWCIEHENDFEEEKVSTKEDKDKQKFSGWPTQDIPLSTIKAQLLEKLGVHTVHGLDNSADTLIDNLTKLWTTFLSSITSSVSDYLSVDHLTLILRMLAGKDAEVIERSFDICGCTEGVPNLIICPQSEMYNTVLTLYSTEDNSPLPLSDEVLLCTPNTTLDMLEIFWRRALFSNGNKIHCLVNADLLDYEVSEKGEKSLERHMKSAKIKGKHYKLVVVCSIEMEYKSRMVAALDKYRIPQMSFGGEAHVKEYLSKRFTVDKLISGIEPASFVDFSRSCVRVVKSWRAGIGKSLFKRNMVAALKANLEVDECVVSIPLYDKNIRVDEVMDILLAYTNPPDFIQPRIFHIDISHEVQEGVDAFLFQLLVLGCLMHSSGHVWRRSDVDYYILESMPLLARDSGIQDGKMTCMHRCLDILPDVLCRSPKESLEILNESNPFDNNERDLIFDETEFASEAFQRPFQYLRRLDEGEDLTDINLKEPDGDKQKCLVTLLRHCGVWDPSWSELYHFVSFLNRQLQDFETSTFCNPVFLDDLPGFRSFVLKLMIQMSRDFATRSLHISEESPADMLKRQLRDENENEDDIEQLYEMRRTWESSPHPYLFFNPDHHTVTFLGFNIDMRTGNLIDEHTGEILEEEIMEPTLRYDQSTLYNGLDSQPGVDLSESFDQLTREEKIEKLCQVMGIEVPHDPDETYELTTDNVKKMLAIYMRFRCDIPVIIMGETGCGKTRLIRYMCALQYFPDDPVENMLIVKVHGGTTRQDIIEKVKKAEEIAKKNAELLRKKKKEKEDDDDDADDNDDENKVYKNNMFTVLFFDEANTTEAIGVIKEIMCDKSLGGKPIHLHERLKIVAACNPYRKHKEELIKKLEQAGLGYHVDADKTTDRLGCVPMRRLVYRVQPLPQSMLPLVWDFGQLNTRVEEMYIRQMVLRYINEERLPDINNLADVLSKMLAACQNFMRIQEDECSFVSLRDVERVLEVMTWFLIQTEKGGLLFDKDNDIDNNIEHINITKALILALGICYQACLKKRKDFRDMIEKYFEEPFMLRHVDELESELIRCQDKFLKNVKLADNIARNQALKENVFMMIVCIEMRIPLFLVGKPGSSKSLAKTIVADAMQGDTARTILFKKFKQVQMVSFQCSPLSTPDGIVGTFRQCSEFQKAKDLDRFVSVVVLDEIGLAEDSPKMPLKTLHPLLEDGCPGDEDPKDYMKVAFIGISNWALDPAKMNRGIFVQRDVPDLIELNNSARGICRTSNDEDGERVLKLIDILIPALSKSYLELFLKAETTKQREFFGLRDFYGLIKMVYSFAAKTGQKPTWRQLKHAIMRNFGGLEDAKSIEIFQANLDKSIVNMTGKREEADPDCSPGGMIKACLEGDKTNTSETRYLLLLTQNYGDLAVLQQKIVSMHDAVVIFGSSFPSDQEYTQVCRNINRIKVNMETGSTIILLNLENLYESLYDALNQYYVYYGGERYVDLGLGSHRVKCKVHRNFRLIVVAEKEIVYKKFPIPLINRLEKHVLSLSTMLSVEQVDLAIRLEGWVADFCLVEEHIISPRNKRMRNTGEVFIGYHADTCAAIIMQLLEDKKIPNDSITQKVCNEILNDAKAILLWCAAPDAVMRLSSTKLRGKKVELVNIYFQYQHHNSLFQYLDHQLKEEKKKSLFSQVTTHSKLLSTPDLEDLSAILKITRQNMTLLTLQSFDTEQQFCRQIKLTIEKSAGTASLLIVQCDCGDQNADLVACARYSIQGELQQTSTKHKGNVYVVLIIQLPRVSGRCFTGFQCGLWHSVHIDELRAPKKTMPTFIEMSDKPISAFLDEYMIHTKDMQTVDAEQKDILQKKECIDIFSLILNCVQPALALVKDPEYDSKRTIERIKIVLNLIQESDKKDTKSFLNGIVMHLTSLLKEKENQESEIHRDWLASKASNPDHVNKAGTFRRATLQCFEEKMTNLLAGVIAFIDTNKNMNICVKDQTETWQKELWIEILNSPKFTGLKYIDLLAQSAFSSKEYMVQGKAFEGGGFSAEMPFSWLIHRCIDGCLQNVLSSKQLDEATHSTLELVIQRANIFKDTPLGQLLSQINVNYAQKAIQCYVADFVHMAYPVKSNLEHNIVCENVITGCKNIIKGEIDVICNALVGCHKTFEMYGTRFKSLSDIVHVWPECCWKVSKYKMEAKVTDFKDDSEEEKMKYLLTNDEITVDLLSLQLLLKNLEPPTKEALNSADNRKEWIKQLCDYRPVVERVFGSLSTDAQDVKYSPERTRGVKEARYLWTRAVVMKLFIEHVCTEDSEVRRCMPLWKMLEKEADMKTIEYVEKVVKFLKSCNKDVSSRIFEKQTCSHCSAPFKGSEKTPPSIPVTLPCLPNHHTICRKCYDETIGVSKFKCPICDHQFEKDMEPIPEYQSENIMVYQNFRRKCNSFFMEVVSQLCFEDSSPPCNKVVEKLLSFITVQIRSGQQVTKELTVFDECIDPTPVVRSFLLQHLIRTSGDKVSTHLEQYFRRASQIVDTSKDDFSKTLDLRLLVLQCMEDSCHQQNSEENTHQIQTAIHMLENACTGIKLGIDKLLENIDHLANTRFALAVAAKYIHKVFTEKSVVLETRLMKLFDTVGKLFAECGSIWPKRYFTKCICRCYGVDSYQTIRRDCDVSIKQWINLPELQKDKTEECCDRFIVLGTAYTQMRETFVRVNLPEDAEQIMNLIPCNKDRWITEIRFCLVVYREITMKYLFAKDQHQFAKVTQCPQMILMNCTKNKELMQDIFTNTVWRNCPDMNISPKMDFGQQGLSCLLAHCLILVRNIPGQNTWITPLTNLANHPELMIEAFFPTMPQDDLDEIKDAVLAARDENGFENPVFYRCPNGHPYMIGDCGRPDSSDRCKDCGEDIGGEDHELKEGNSKDVGMDTTDTGHILGKSGPLNAVPYPVRKLNRANCAIMKFLLHMAMFVGANYNIQAVCRSIKPKIELSEVHTYIMDHMKNDLISISSVLGKSKEDVLLLIHFLLFEIMNTLTSARIGERVEDEVCFLKDKRSREIWEDIFNKRYIEPVLEESEEILKGATQKLLSDERFGADPLLQLLYETNKTTEKIGIGDLCDNSAVWQFRERISVDHLHQMFSKSSRNYPVLKQFLEEEIYLRAIRFVPSIIKLHRKLIQKYNRNINRQAASSESMEQVLLGFNNDPDKEDLERWWTDFKQAWENMKQALDGYCFTVNGNLVCLNRENCAKRIDDTTALSYILPAKNENGLCSLALLFFLLEKQNLFLQKYCLQIGEKYDSLPRVHVRNISAAHLISYHPDRDLLPMVLSNCNYSFEVGQGVKVKYNFSSLERRLMDRLLFTKSVILLKEIDTMVYRSESTNAVVFMNLRDKIRQERISSAVLGQIQEELRTKTFPELCGGIDKLDIAISFLKSVGSDPDSLLEDFMVNILKLNDPFVSRKAQQSCKCKHVQSLWISLTLEKTKRLDRGNEESFDSLSSLKKELSKEQDHAVRGLMEGLQLEQLDVLSETVFECILLNIGIPKKDEESVDMSKEGLKEALSAYLFDPPYVNEAPKPDWLKQVVEALPVARDTRVLGCHVVETWGLIYDVLTGKQDKH